MSEVRVSMSKKIVILLSVIGGLIVAGLVVTIVMLASLSNASHSAERKAGIDAVCGALAAPGQRATDDDIYRYKACVDRYDATH